MKSDNPVKLNALADMQLHSQDLPGIIKAFESMEIEKVKLLCRTAVLISLIAGVSLSVSIGLIAL